MAPLPPPSAAAEPPHHSKTPGGVLLSSAFRRLPFPLPLPPSKPSTLDHHSLGARSSLFAAVDRCFKDLAAVVSEHPFLKTLLSLHSNVQSFCQIRCRSSRIAILPHAHNFAAILPGDSVAGLVVANGINNFLNLYNTLLVIRLVLTWFPNSPPAIVSPLSTICDPYLNIFRGIIPPLGGTLDLSPILAFLVLNAFTSTAAALPAELPAPGTSTIQEKNILDRHRRFDLTTTREKWMRRVCCKKSENC